VLTEASQNVKKLNCASLLPGDHLYRDLDLWFNSTDPSVISLRDYGFSFS